MRRLVVACLVASSILSPLASPVASQSVGTGSARAPLPLKPPPPDVAALVPFVSAPLDKPVIDVPRLALPRAPVEVPPVAPAAIAAPEAPKPHAPLPSPRKLPCVGAWLGIASESLECGRARFSRGETEDAVRALEQASRSGAERELVAEARYWLAEANYRLGRIEQADWLFRQVLADLAVADLGPWALHGAGWTALRLGDAARAEDAFRRLLAAPQPVPLDAWGRHGLALSLYARSRFQDAEKVWAELIQRKPPATLERDVAFWHGDTLARLGQLQRGVDELTVFTGGGPHTLLAAGRLRLAWWSLAAGHAAESLATLRALIAGAPADSARERDWVDAGLALALIATGDWAGALTALAPLDGRRSTLALPVKLRFIGAAVENGQAAEALGVVQELLSANLPPAVRAWVLLVKGEALRADGNRDEARTQFDLARGTSPDTDVARQATLRLGQMNFELREFAQAAGDVAPLLAATTDPQMRAAALLLRGEAAYHAGDYAAAADAYRRVLVEFPALQQAPAVRLALAWTALRRGARDDALRRFQEFAQAAPNDPHAVDALELASELMLATGQLDAARALLERIVTTYPTHPRVEFARLNRALLMLRTGQAPAAQRELAAWIGRAPSPPLEGRAVVALGAAFLRQGRPADAAREFTRAQGEGMGELARLGLGTVALVDERWDDAVRELTQARDNGTKEIAAAAEYGLAVVAFHKGKAAEFKTAARAALDAAPRGATAPRLLYVLTALAVADKDWPTALDTAKRLTAEFPDDEAADDALERVGNGAAGAAAWPVAYEAYALLRQRYPQSPFVADSALAFAQAQIETNHAAEARRQLESLVAATPADSRAPQGWVLLGRAREAAGDRAGALDAFARATQAGDKVVWTPDALLAQARLLAAENRWDEARAALDRVLHAADGAAAAQAALGMGQAWAAQGNAMAATEYFMTAAYLSPESAAGRRALIAAGQAFAAAKDADSAAIVYRKLLSQADVPADLAAEARKGLADLKR